MKKTEYILCIAFLLLFSAVGSSAQSALSPITISLTNRDGDTVVYRREAAEWRIGPTMSGTLHYHFGKIIMPVNPQYPCDGYYMLDGGAMGGGGMTIGVAFDYQQPDELWGFSFLGNIYDYRSTTTYTNIAVGPTHTNFPLDSTVITKASVGYVSFMPQARYNIVEYPGLHLLMGLDIDVKVSQKMQRYNTHYDLERVDVIRDIPFQADNLRLGGAFGAGWDMLAGVIGDYRMDIEPYALFHVGSNIYSRNGSNWNSVYGQFGVALKFGEDIITNSVIPRNPAVSSEPANSELVKTDDKINVVMPESRGMMIEMLVPSMMDAATAVDQSSAQTTPTQTAPNKVPYTGRLVANSMQIFSTYNNALDTALSPKLKGYLDAVADYLQRNPSAQFRIVGHADNFGGTPIETQRVSDERALQVVRYLIRQGISRDRLLASGLGARSPIQNNRSPQGRIANRRVELTIVQ